MAVRDHPANRTSRLVGRLPVAHRQGTAATYAYTLCTPALAHSRRTTLALSAPSQQPAYRTASAALCARSAPDPAQGAEEMAVGQPDLLRTPCVQHRASCYERRTANVSNSVPVRARSSCRVAWTRQQQQPAAQPSSA